MNGIESITHCRSGIILTEICYRLNNGKSDGIKKRRNGNIYYFPGIDNLSCNTMFSNCSYTGDISIYWGCRHDDVWGLITTMKIPRESDNDGERVHDKV